MNEVIKKNKVQKVKFNVEMGEKRMYAMETLRLIDKLETECGRIVKFKMDDLATAQTFQNCWEAANGDDLVAREIYETIWDGDGGYNGFVYCSEYMFYTFFCYNFDFGSIDHLPEKLKNDIRRHYKRNEYLKIIWNKYNVYSD